MEPKVELCGKEQDETANDDVKIEPCRLSAKIADTRLMFNPGHRVSSAFSFVLRPTRIDNGGVGSWNETLCPRNFYATNALASAQEGPERINGSWKASLV